VKITNLSIPHNEAENNNNNKSRGQKMTISEYQLGGTAYNTKADLIIPSQTKSYILSYDNQRTPLQQP
jgi:hypothetical protein